MIKLFYMMMGAAFALVLKSRLDRSARGVLSRPTPAHPESSAEDEVVAPLSEV